MELSGHNAARVREVVENSLFALGSVGAIGNQLVVQTISKGNGVKPKILASFKHIVSRLNILSAFAAKFQIGKKDVPLSPLMEFAAKQVVHQNAEVRTAAIALFVQAHQQVGER